jgi:L-aminopeptidase/D-esterase-like protein
VTSAAFIPDLELNPFFAATIESIDEAVLNALVANETMTGADDHVVHALPHAEVRRLIGAGA